MLMSQIRWISLSGRALATVALMTTGGFLLHAQTASPSGTSSVQSVSAQEPIFEQTVQAKAGDELYSTSNAEMSGVEGGTTQVALNTVPAFHFLDAMQYGGGRQRYGRPKYRGGNTNADGSSKYDFYVGAGFQMPVGTQFNYATTGWGFAAGGGRMFNKLAGVNLEFNYDHFGMTEAAVHYYSGLYGDSSNTNGFGGNVHVWSLSLQPVINLKAGEGWGAYVTGGVGFYHKVSNFTLPQQQVYCDPYYGFCQTYVASANFDHYTSNAPGFDGGFGFTYKISRFANERFFAEVRYTYMLNTYKPGLTVANAPTYTGNNLFPENSQRTAYIPVKFGLRF